MFVTNPRTKRNIRIGGASFKQVYYQYGLKAFKPRDRKLIKEYMDSIEGNEEEEPEEEMPVLERTNTKLTMKKPSSIYYVVDDDEDDKDDKDDKDDEGDDDDEEEKSGIDGEEFGEELLKDKNFARGLLRMWYGFLKLSTDKMFGRLIAYFVLEKQEELLQAYELIDSARQNNKLDEVRDEIEDRLAELYRTYVLEQIDDLSPKETTHLENAEALTKQLENSMNDVDIPREKKTEIIHLFVSKLNHGMAIHSMDHNHEELMEPILKKVAKKIEEDENEPS